MALYWLSSAFNFRKYWTWTTRNYGEHFSIWKEIMLLDATKWPRSDVDTSWWKRDKIFWWDKRNWWLQFSKVEVVLPVISPAVWFAVAFFYRLAYNSNFLSRGSLEESQKRRRIDLPLHMDLHLLSQNTKICAVLSTTRINKLKHHLGPILRSKRK